MAASVDRVLEQLWAHAGDRSLFAIVDGARDRRLARVVTASGLAQRCLYAGRLAPALARVAPRLVALPRASALARRLVAEGWGRGHATYVCSRAGLPELHRHFRRFLRVRDERGRILAFRYYDPRVLRVYLPTCTQEELDYVFGPVEAYLVEAADPDGMLVFGRSAAGLAVEPVEVAQVLGWLGRYLRTGHISPAAGEGGGGGGE